MNHTETPWVLCQQDGAKLAYTIFASSQLKAGWIEVAEWDSYVALAGGLNSGNAEANARRIVACVNACEGISTENLEYGLPVKELVQQCNEAIWQRDELLAALEEIAQHAGLGHQIANFARKAIASVKGGAA